MGIKPITPTEAQSLPELELRKCEYLALRAMLRHSAATGFGAATTKAGLVDPTLITPAVAYCFTLLSAYKLSNVIPTVRILQKKVERRGLTPMDPKTKDGLEALATVTFGQLTGGAVGGDLAVTAGFDKLAEETTKQTLGEGITGSSGMLLDQEVAEKMEAKARATAEAKTNLAGAGGPPPSGCTRQGIHTRILCDKCGDAIDTAFETYSHCCLCGGGENYDVCSSCTDKASSLACDSGHPLYLIKPSNPPDIPNSRRSIVDGLACHASHYGIDDTDFYQCQSCNRRLQEFDMCLDCFRNNKTCPYDHSWDKFRREHSESIGSKLKRWW